MNDPQGLPPTDLWAALLRMMTALGIILVFLALSYWLLKRFLRHRQTKGGNAQAIQVIEKRMISPKTMLYLVEVDGKKILFAESHLEIQELGRSELDERAPIRIGD